MVRMKKTRRIAPRFYVFCIILITLVVGGIYFAVKTFSNTDTLQNANENETITPSSQENQTSSDGTEGDIQINGDTMTGGGMNANPTNTINPTIIEYDMEVYNAILASNYTNVVGKTKAEVTALFGDVIRYEDWNGGIYFHKNFPENMYVGYSGSLAEDGSSLDESICSAVEISLKQIKPDLIDFKIGNAIWGKPIPDETGEGWTNHYYSVNLGKGITMFLYCNEKGHIDADTHVFVKFGDL